MAEKQPNLNNVPESMHSILTEGYEFNFGQAFTRGFELFRQEAVNLLIFSIGFWAMGYIANTFAEEFNTALQGAAGDPDMTLTVLRENYFGFGGGVLFVISLLQVPLTAGYYLYLNKVTLGETPTFNDLLGGFRYIGPLLLATIIMFVILIISAFTIFGLIYLAIGYGFVYLIIVLHGTGAWEGLETSRKIIHQKWWPIFGFFVVLGLFNFALGQLPLQIGILVAAPLVACISYAAFEDIVYVQHGSGYDSRIDEIGSDDDF